MNPLIKYEIMEAMLNYVTNASADGYGQLNTMPVHAVFGNRTKEFLEYLEKDPIIKVSTYGWTYGTYKGIGGLHDIQDGLLRTKCQEAWANNKSRTRNLNQW
jgi:hypothetical protein